MENTDWATIVVVGPAKDMVKVVLWHLSSSMGLAEVVQLWCMTGMLGSMLLAKFGALAGYLLQCLCDLVPVR